MVINDERAALCFLLNYCLFPNLLLYFKGQSSFSWLRVPSSKNFQVIDI